MATGEHSAQSLLRQAHPPEQASAIFKERVLHKPLLLRPTSPDASTQDARSRRRKERLRRQENLQRRQRPKPLSAKEKRISGIYDVPEDGVRYEIYQPLHELWQGYMQEILGLKDDPLAFVTAQSAGPKVASAEFNGAQLRVVRSRCAGMVGLEGIVIRDTKFTFQIVTRGDKVKTIPKRHTVFSFEVCRPQQQQDDDRKKAVAAGSTSPLMLELHGSHFELRSADRATKKFKQHPLTDL